MGGQDVDVSLASNLAVFTSSAVIDTIVTCIPPERHFNWRKEWREFLNRDNCDMYQINTGTVISQLQQVYFSFSCCFWGINVC